jgi:lipoate synthase
MVGMGETEEDVMALMDDLRAPGVDCQIMTIGQYLQPRKKGIPVAEYIHPDTFERYRVAGREKGFGHVFAGPFVRSSYNAREAMLAAQGGANGTAGDPEGRSFMTEDMSGRNVAVGMLPIYP